jgi:hypothetical protein
MMQLVNVAFLILSAVSTPTTRPLDLLVMVQFETTGS